MGIYLGRSPNHGRNVALVLDRSTGLVSPQFHVTFDSSFHTVKQDDLDSKWQAKAGLVTKEPAPAAAKRKLDANEPRESHGVTVAPEGVLRKRLKTFQPSVEGGTSPLTSQTTSVRTRVEDGSKPSTNDSPSPGHAKAPGPPKIQDNGGPRKEPVPTWVIAKAMMAELSQATSGDVEGEIFCLQAMFPTYADETGPDPLHILKATTDPDTMYLHQAMKEPDAEEFKKAMQKEWDDQLSNGNFTIHHRSEVPEGATVLPAVWQMKRKRDIKTRRIKKYKARLNIDGSRMRPGIHYDQTYAPVVSWNSIRTLLVMSALHKWHTRQIDYVLAFPQAPVEREIWMEIPKGFHIKEGNSKDYVLQLHRNVYGQKQAGRVWNQYLTDILINKVGFKQSEVDECVFYRGSVMYVLYTDDSILAGPDSKEIDQAIEDIKRAKLNITIEGDIQDFLGVNISHKPDGSIHLTQPHLIDQILQDLHMQDNTKPRTTPAASSRLLSRHSSSPDFNGAFNYRSVIGKLNYLDKGSRSDVAYITHQCARFTTCPKEEHGAALKWLGRYLVGTRDKGTILKPDKTRELEVHVDADFAGNWDPAETEDRDTARLRHGYIISYAGCPILWKSQLQSKVALSSTESEYTGLSYALRDAIPIMNLLSEMKQRGFPIRSSKAKVHCKVFEDNTGALEIAKIHKYRPRTKHLNNWLHHFRSYVDNKQITIHKIDTKDQPADFLTKPLNEEMLVGLRSKVLGW